MTILFDSCVRPVANVLVRELEGESVLLNLDSESYYGLDEIGTRMWFVVNASDSIEAAYQILLTEYEVDADKLRQDLLKLVEDWIEHGLVNQDEG